MAHILIGISGWRYEGWRGVFYPDGLPQRRELEFAAHTLPSIEINGSFYSLQRPESYARWYQETPAGFVFSVKGSRYITHIRRLRDIDQALAVAVYRRLSPLKNQCQITAPKADT